MQDDGAVCTKIQVRVAGLVQHLPNGAHLQQVSTHGFWEYVEHGLHGGVGMGHNGNGGALRHHTRFTKTNANRLDEMSPVIGEHPHTRPQLTPKAALVQ